jgi:hypothetical protein
LQDKKWQHPERSSELAEVDAQSKDADMDNRLSRARVDEKNLAKVGLENSQSSLKPSQG